MIGFIIGCVIGFAIGTLFGFVVTALVVAAGRSKDE